MKKSESTTEEEAPADNPVLQTLEKSQLTSSENLPSGVDFETVKAKMAAGLTKEQAIEVCQTQAEHDKALAEAATQ